MAYRRNKPLYIVGTGRHNPHHAESLPQFALRWGENVRRPELLPEVYDTRISDDSIFFLHNGLEASDEGVYVVADRCDCCRGQQQTCTRGRPSCERCLRMNVTCKTSSARWVLLPGPKIKKGCRAQAISAATQETRLTMPMMSEIREVGPAGNRRTLRPRTKPVDYNPPPALFRSPSVEPPSSLSYKTRKRPTTVLLTHAKVKKRKFLSAMAARKGKLSVLNGGVGLSQANVRGPRTRKTGKKTASTLKNASHPRVLSRRGRRRAAGGSLGHPLGDTDATAGCGWKVVHPPPLIPTVHGLDLPERRTELSAGRTPRIWAASKADLFEVIPELAQNVNGVLWMSAEVETPVIIIEGPAWPGDKWDGGTVLEWSTARSYTTTTKSTSNIAPPSGPEPTRSTSTSDPPSASELMYPPMTETTMSSLLSIPPTRPASPSGPAIVERSETLPLTEASQSSSSTILPLPSSPMPVTLQHHARGPSYHNHPFSLSKFGGTATPPVISGIRPGSYCTRPHFYYPVPHVAPFMAYAPRHYAQPPYYSWPIYGSTVGYLQYPLQSSDNARDDLSESKSMDIDPDSLHSDDYQPNLPAPQVASRSCSPEGTMGSEHAVASGVLKYPPHTDMDVVAHDDALGDVSDGLQSISSQLTRGAHEGTSETTSASLVTYSPETVIPQQTTSHPASELSGQVATPAPGSSTPQCQAQPRFHVAEERSDTQSLDDLLPKESPPEIKALYDFFESQVLVTLIISQNSSLLPFELPAQCGCAMLGLFRITGVQSEDRIHDDANTGERTLERLWRFQFAWVPGGEVPRPEAQDLPPWWASMPADTPEGHAASIGTPFMIPQYLLFADLLPPEAFEGSAVEQVASGWYCVRCGMLNVQRNLRYQKCGSCLLGNNKRIPPVDADVVRDSHRTASATFPFDKHASGVALKATVASDGMHVLRYEMSNLGAVTHFFTGNADALQEQPSTLFKELQRSVELVFRGFKTGAAAGPHYAYFAGSHSEYEPYAVAWSDVPESIMRTRELMQSRVRTSGEKSLFGINQLVALAWTRSGSRKGYVLSAQESDIVMLCLGADVELSISSKLSTSSARKTPSAQLVRVDAGRETLSDFAPMDCVENRSYASNAGMSMYVFDTSGDPEGDPNVASASAVTSSTASHSRAHRREHESLSVTLVHGDMLLLSGDEYEYTLTRTGMSILLMGSQ